uniref:DUF2067 domain-containing protein n=1 Tax=Ignisphaera aggregans TaxID=334771 RepID=A0A7C2VDP5_9CREN
MPKPSGVYVEKTFTYPCASTAFCLEILEKIDEELSLEADLRVDFKLNKLVFRVMGLEPNVQMAMVKLREFLALYASPRLNPRRGVKAEVLAKQLKKTIPLDVLAIVVRKVLGVPAEAKGHVIYADTDFDALLSMAKKVAEAQQRVEKLGLSSSLKKLLIAAVALYNVDYREVLEVLQQTQMLGDKNELKAPWHKVLEEIESFFEEL